MTFAIDINDVIRAFTKNFAKVYQKEYDRTFNENDIEITTNDLSKVFPFDSIAEYRRFVYQDYPFELFGKCDTIDSSVAAAFNMWLEELKNIDADEDMNVMIVSTMEYGLTIQSTFFFLSKMGCRVRECYFPVDSATIWDRCDVLITANPKLIESKPENKTVVKINADYNKNISGDYEFNKAADFFSDINNTLTFIKSDE
jgi:hypothetical protein